MVRHPGYRSPAHRTAWPVATIPMPTDELAWIAGTRQSSTRPVGAESVAFLPAKGTPDGQRILLPTVFVPTTRDWGGGPLASRPCCRGTKSGPCESYRHERSLLQADVCRDTIRTPCACRRDGGTSDDVMPPDHLTARDRSHGQRCRVGLATKDAGDCLAPGPARS